MFDKNSCLNNVLIWAMKLFLILKHQFLYCYTNKETILYSYKE